MTTQLLEPTSSPIKKGSKWRVTLATPGQGTSGYYPEEVLRRDGPSAIPPGTKAWWSHEKRADGRDMVGVYEGGAFWDEEQGALVADLSVFPHWKDVVDALGPYAEASLKVSARKNKGTDVVGALLFDRANSVDIVGYAGLEGSGLKYQVESLLEAARTNPENTVDYTAESLFAAASADGEQVRKKENDMEIKQKVDALSSVIETLAAKFDTFVAESKIEVKGVADKAAVDAAVEARVAEALADIAEVEKSIDDADIPAVIKESLKESARKGEDITENLAGAVAIVAEAKKEFTAEPPKVLKRGKVIVVDESLDSEPKKNFRVGRWS